MIAISPGLLHSSFKLLEMVSKREHQLSSLAMSLPRIEIMPASEVVSFALAMGWVGSDDTGRATMTASGARVYQSHRVLDRFRHALLDYIGVVSPAWAQLTPRGRQETLSALAPEVRQCFAEAELVFSYSDEVVRWWDALASRARGQRSEILLAIGRIGERLSFLHEEKRTGKMPQWESVESNLAGYDILSIVGPDDPRKLQIEVKASQAAINHGSFHVSRGEWETALVAERYAFHLWALGEKTCALAILDKWDVSVHVPADQGNGTWESVEVPFAPFVGAFSEQPLK